MADKKTHQNKKVDIGDCFLGGRSSFDTDVSVLLRIWRAFGSCGYRLFRRALIVEKNMLWYNQRSMGRKRRSREFKNNSRVIDIEDARKQRLEKRRAEKKKEEERVRRAAGQKTRGKMAIRRSRNRRRLLIVIIVVAITGAIAFSVFNVISLKKEQREMREQQEGLTKEKAQLEKELSEINNPENLEEQARDQLRLIKKGEYLYIFPDEITKAGKAAEESVEKSISGSEEE